MALQPVKGTFRIKDEEAKYMSRRAGDFNYQVIDSRPGQYFIVPVTTVKTVKTVTPKVMADYCRWVYDEQIYEVQED